MRDETQNENQIGDQIINGFTAVLNKNGYGFHYSVIRKAKELAETGKSLFRFEASEFPIRVQGKDTRIDFILKKVSGGGAWIGTLFLIAECKRVNPAYSDWCFVKSPYTNEDQPRNDNRLITESLLRDEDKNSILNFARSSLHINENYHIGFEIKTDKPGDTKGETGQAIEIAATQVLRGLNGFIQTMDKEHHLWKRSYNASFLPVIFTTANLFVSDADISLADLLTGEMNLTKEQVKAVPWLYFQYSLSPGLKHLISSEEETKNISSLLMKDYVRTIPIVSAAGIEDFLVEISKSNIENF